MTSIQTTSIRRRLSVGLALSLVGVFVLLGLGVSFSFRLLTEDYILSRLEHDTESLLAAVTVIPANPAPVLSDKRVDAVYEKPFSGHYYVIESDGHELRSRSLWDQTLQVRNVAVGESVKLRLLGPRQQLLLVRVSAYRKAGRVLNIAVAEDLTPIRHEVREFQARYIAFGLAVMVLLLLLQWRILTRGLRPLNTTCSEIGELERGMRDQLSENVPTEIQPVVHKVNHLLTIMQQRLIRSRNAMGNLAHALKTPLTLLGQIADRDANFHSVEQAAAARDLVERIRSLTERELKRARMAGAYRAVALLDVGEELQALAGVLRQLYSERGVQIVLQIPPGLKLAADREDFHELFGNLLDNACKWARARVRLLAESATQPAPGVRITIEDDGPGRSLDELEHLNQRGVRVDEQAVPGHGLGLAIAQEIVSHYGARLTLGKSSDLGGFSAELWMPGLDSV